ncbi:MAG TPA: hypothetical protein DEB63_18995 [Agrobacterium sp.]|uniref:copper chaperone PCu(A)C n=1 Tax=Rhizobium sp. TaxID=391 RepID=UPI000E8BEE98|nr:hypothetical protein [Agrobacterium sp.]
MAKFTSFRLVTPAVFLLTSAISVSAHDFKVGDLKIDHPWSRATPMVAPVAGGYVIVTNNGGEPDTLLGGTTPMAAKVEIHESTMTDGVARMRPLTGGLVIEPGKTVELRPGGTHLMFVRPSRQLKEGERFKVTLAFEKAGQVEVEFAVQGMGSQPTAKQEHEGHGKTE